MKKNEYVTPQMEIVELDGEALLLTTSQDTPGQGGFGETPGEDFDGGAD